MSTNYDQVWENYPFILETGIWHKMACCDCGLVHKWKLTHDTADGKNVVIVEAKVAKGATKKNRKINYRGLVIPPKKEITE